MTNEADYLTVSSEQVLINSDTGLLSPVDVIFVNTDIIEVLKVDDDLDRSKVNISIDFATKSKAEIFDEIKVGNVLIENKKKNFKFSQANGWSTLAGEVEIDAKRISGATDEKSGMDKLQIDIRHSFMDVHVIRDNKMSENKTKLIFLEKIANTLLACYVRICF